jgi:hypothetical protein
VRRYASGLPRLIDEVPAFEALLGVPADLAGEEDEQALGGNAVGIAFRSLPAL